MATETPRPTYAAGACEIDLAARELRVAGSPARIGARAFELLEILVQSAGHLVTKDGLMNRVWSGAVVMESTLHVHVSALRKALGPCRHLLKTESGRGYRLLGEWTLRPQVSPAGRSDPHRTDLPATLPVTNLPAEVTGLVGRSSAVQSLRNLVSAYRATTLTGPGGIGKTALALDVGRVLTRDFADGVWLVELASLSDPGLVPSVAGAALGLYGADALSASAIAHAVAGKSLLLLLDNCEHVVGAAAALADMLLRCCPGVSILATSREILRIPGERVYRVAALEVPEADQADADQMRSLSGPELFLARVNARGADFSADRHLAKVAAICRHLDGIPLAIEFAAARAATLGIEQAAVGLRDRFALLTHGSRTAMPRHRTLRSVFDWSYQLLPTAEQQSLRWLAIFPSGFDIYAARALLDGQHSPQDIIDGVVDLVEKSLLNMVETAPAASYRMLETVRSYCLERLRESAEFDAAAASHARHVRNVILGEELGPTAGPRDLLQDDRERLKPVEIHNVRSALDWCFSPEGDIDIGLQITAGYARTWLHLSLMNECRARIEIALERPELTSHLRPDLIMELYIALSVSVIHTSGRVEDTEASLDKALEVADWVGDDAARLRALWAIWDYRSNNREYAKALSTARKFERMAARTGTRSAILVANRLLGHSLHYHGQQAAARARLEEVLKLDPEHEQARIIWFQYDQRVLAGAVLARVLWILGYPEQAMQVVGVSCAEAAEISQKLSQCYVHAMAAFPLACLAGDLLAAEQALETCTQVANKNHFSFYQKWCECLRGCLLIEQGNFGAGTAVLSRALPALGRVACRQPEFQSALARGLTGLGNLTQALEVIGTAVIQANTCGELWYLPELARVSCEIRIAGNQVGSGGVERRLRHALRLAHEQGARSWELRTAMTLARNSMFSPQKLPQAREALSALVRQFSEGFASADLSLAQQLLTTLADT